MSRAAAIVGILGLVAAAIGCVSAPGGPPDLRLGEDVCDACGMIVSEWRTAAAASVPAADGAPRVYRYDDIGCMLSHEAAAGATLRWVGDCAGGEWIEARSAVYLRSKRMLTPMLYGIVGCSDRDAALRLQERYDGDLAEFEVLAGLAAAGELRPLAPGEQDGGGMAAQGDAER